ncbi:MAG TPA: glycerophosphodiester phosphodiesterase family protein [Pirellulales bacterium]|nr:glycerophosphodiester phosphodiesterase family protein [Pirellulales bacterium]
MSYRHVRVIMTTLCVCLLSLGAKASAVEVVCHRGANEYAPENTLAAAELCIEWGVAYVEIDVRTSKDGVMYILHDPWVNRTTNGKGFLFQLTSDQIDALDAGSWFDKEFAGEKVPRLEPYLRAIKGRIKVYFDVKHADLPALIKLVYDVGMEKDCFFWFDRPERALEFRQLDKELPLKVNVSNVADVREAAERYRANIVETSLRNMTDELVHACRERDLKIMILSTKKDPEAFRQIVERKADLVNLDHGDVFLKVEKQVREEAAGASAGGK